MSTTRTLRSLLRELRLAAPDGNIKDSLAANYILGQYKKLATTDQQLCRAREEAKFLGSTYLTYLVSRRRYEELYKEYHGRGERSVRETANIVGFKLPHDPQTRK